MVRLHTHLLDPTLDIFLLLMRRKQVVRMILYICSKATLSVALPWLSDVIAQWNAGATVCFRPWEEVAVVESLILRCFQPVQGREHVNVFDSIFVSVELTTLSRFNMLGRAANSQILLAGNLKVCTIVLFNMFKSPAV